MLMSVSYLLQNHLSHLQNFPVIVTQTKDMQDFQILTLLFQYIAVDVHPTFCN